MIRFRQAFATSLCGLCLTLGAAAQTATPAAATGSESQEILSLMQKIDQQNIKIDLLSQQILRLQQEIEHPGTKTTTGSAVSAPVATAVAPAPTAAPVAAGSENTHVVAKGETLTSIARMHKVSVSELQKINHIENDRKLQIGQTLVLPTTASASPSPSAAAPNE